MEKNTVLAVVLSTIVLVVFFAIQNSMAAKQPPLVKPEQPPVIATDSTNDNAIQQAEISSDPVSDFAESDNQFEDDTGPQEVKFIPINTNTLNVILTNIGGDMISWKLKDHLDKNDNVDMIFLGTGSMVPSSREAMASRAFSIAFGNIGTPPVNNLFHVNQISEHTVEFYRDFYVQGNTGKFRLIKRYDFKPNDYMFELTVTLEGEASVSNYNFNGAAYTLSFGPQIGPKFAKLDARNDYRQYYSYVNGKRKSSKLNDEIDTRPAWLTISGKYFTMIAIPHLAQFSAKFTDTPEPGVPSASRLSIARPAANMRTVTDTYKFYLGPKSQEALSVYHTGRNDFGFKDSSLTQVASSRGVLAPLERLLKWLLVILYKVFPNYGIAIIILTLIIKLAFFPLTKKSSEATSRMQELQPRIQEIQEKYKGNPQKINTEMAALYQKEGYNPLSGCLPMLLQFPIFIAMYNLFNNHFDLRGAMFIPGWIPDLSLPEAIFNFPGDFRLPILGWTAIRALPFIYVGSQLLYGKFTQTPGQQSAGQMKLMMYAMPVLFFFILYNVPSGLLLYWIFSNIFTLVQQIIINKYKQAKNQNVGTIAAATETRNVTVPPKKRKNKR